MRIFRILSNDFDGNLRKEYLIIKVKFNGYFEEENLIDIYGIRFGLI